MQKIFTIVIIILLLPSFSSAQRWKRQRVEYSFALGATNFLGELGGADQIASASVRDLDFSATRYAIGAGYRYQLTGETHIKGNFIYALVSGDDAYTNEPARSARQLNFKAPVLELSAQLEYVLFGPESNSLYKLRGVRGRKGAGLKVYVFLGLGGIWYDPRGKKDGEWFRLRPLHTEGQGLEARFINGNGVEDQILYEPPKQYSGFSVVIPSGIGIKKDIFSRPGRDYWSLGFELTYRKTFTDYIDDVSTNYYGSDFIRDAYGDDAAFFADPSGIYKDHTKFGEEQQRGDPSDKDAYILGLVSLNYRFSKKRRRRSLPKF